MVKLSKKAKRFTETETMRIFSKIYGKSKYLLYMYLLTFGRTIFSLALYDLRI